MRLWSIHPEYLDAKGLVALWREALLAQKVLQGNTKGYKEHPQLIRFRETEDPLGVIASYLLGVAVEADNRGYQFDRSKVAANRCEIKIPVTTGQVRYEFEHLMRKLKVRDREQYLKLRKNTRIHLHPIFKKVKGGIEPWEVV